MTMSRKPAGKRVRAFDPSISRTIFDLAKTLDASGHGGIVSIHVPSEEENGMVDLNVTMQVPRAVLLREIEEEHKKSKKKQ